MVNRKPGKKHRKNNSVPEPDVPDDKKTRFSFEKLDTGHDKFALSNCGGEFWIELVQTLREAESISFDRFVERDHAQARHEIDFDKTIAPDGFFPGFNSDQLIPFQFPVPLNNKKKGWRVYGYYANGFFYIVWLDVCHALYK